MTALETEDRLLLSGFTESGEDLDDSQCRRLFDLPGRTTHAVLDSSPAVDRLAELQHQEKQSGSWTILPPVTARGLTPKWTSSITGQKTGELD